MESKLRFRLFGGRLAVYDSRCEKDFFRCWRCFPGFSFDGTRPDTGPNQAEYFEQGAPDQTRFEPARPGRGGGAAQNGG